MPGLAPYKSILAIGKRVKITARGTTVFLRKASGELAVTVRSLAIGDADGAQYTLRMEEAEEWLHADTFDQIVLENVSGIPNTIELYLGFGRFVKPVPDIVNVQVSSSNNNVATTIADKINIDVGNAGKEQLLAQDNNRVSAWITALTANVENIRIGDEDITETRGTPLAPGDTILWSSKDECFACSVATANQSAALTEFSG